MKSQKYALGKTRKAQQLVASTVTPVIGNKGRKSLKRRKSKFNRENVPSSNSNILSPRLRQTVISEYFTSPKSSSSSKEQQPVCKQEPDANNDAAAAPKMVNIPRLLSQLLRAKVVLNRVSLPVVKETTTTTSPIKTEQQASTESSPDINVKSQEVQRYCYKCKILEKHHRQVSVKKFCKRCKTLLVYVCVDCNVAHFIKYKHMRKHIQKCRGNSGDLTMKDALDSIVIYHCADCSFMCTYARTLNIHLKNMNHRLSEGERVVGDKRDGWQKFDPKNPYIVKRPCRRLGKSIKRYCSKCKKIVLGIRSKDHLPCVECKTFLLFKCGECNFKSDNYRAAYYHAKAECFANQYRCEKCHYIASNWRFMYTHLETKKCSRLPDKKFYLY